VVVFLELKRWTSSSIQGLARPALLATSEAIAAEMVVCMADWLQQQGGDDEQQAAYARQQDIFQLRAADVTVESI
jgi:hypothetical protein